MDHQSTRGLQQFRNFVAIKFQLYNSLLTSLPFHLIEKTVILLSMLLNKFELGYKRKQRPVLIPSVFEYEDFIRDPASGAMVANSATGYRIEPASFVTTAHRGRAAPWDELAAQRDVTRRAQPYAAASPVFRYSLVAFAACVVASVVVWSFGRRALRRH